MAGGSGIGDRSDPFASIGSKSSGTDKAAMTEKIAKGKSKKREAKKIEGAIAVRLLRPLN
jgi:hypothetical protein